MRKRIYLDHAATTYLDSRVLKEMLPFFCRYYGNPSTIYKEGRIARKAIENARKKIGSILNCKKEEIIFLPGITFSDNLAILGTARANKSKGNHLITTKLEHSAVKAPLNKLEKEGFKITYLPNDKYGLINPNHLKKALTKKTILVSIIYAHNEIGTIQPISILAKIIRSFEKQNNTRIYFHTDAAQAPGLLSLDVKKLNIDLMTFGASKIYGPKGIAVLYIKKDVPVKPLFFGGHHEKGLVPGTENVPGIIGLAKALEIVDKKRPQETKRLAIIRDYLIKKVLNKIPQTYLNGHPKKRLANNIHFSIKNIEGESLILQLDKYKISASTGSACLSKDLKPSITLLNLGLPPELAHGSLRLTLGKKTTKKDADYVFKILVKVVKKLRTVSALK